jgi:RNA polymerase sigma factor (sigma-70 family)
MTSTFDHTDGPITRENYIADVYAALRVNLRRSVSPDTVDEVLQQEALRLMESLDSVMRRYPQPEAYAHVRGSGRRALIDHLRKEAVQRGAGARNTRIVLDIDSEYGSPASAGPDLAEEFVEADASARLLAQALVKVPARDAALLWRVKAEGVTVVEAAAEVGIVRETASRKIASALQVARASVDF